MNFLFMMTEFKIHQSIQFLFYNPYSNLPWWLFQFIDCSFSPSWISSLLSSWLLFFHLYHAYISKLSLLFPFNPLIPLLYNPSCPWVLCFDWISWLIWTCTFPFLNSITKEFLDFIVNQGHKSRIVWEGRSSTKKNRVSPDYQSISFDGLISILIMEM